MLNCMMLCNHLGDNLTRDIAALDFDIAHIEFYSTVQLLKR
jgi:hypothetical protein